MELWRGLLVAPNEMLRSLGGFLRRSRQDGAAGRGLKTRVKRGYGRKYEKKKVFEITWSGWRPSHILYIFLGWSRFDFVFWGVVGPTLGAAIGQLLSDESSCRRCSKRILCLRVARSCKKVILEGRFFSASLADVSCITTVRSSCVVGSKKTPGDWICLFLLIFFSCSDKKYRINRGYNRLFIMLRLLFGGSSNTPGRRFYLHLQYTLYRGRHGSLAKVRVNVPIYVYVSHRSGNCVPNVSISQHDERSTSVE